MLTEVRDSEQSWRPELEIALQGHHSFLPSLALPKRYPTFTSSL
jgi:hypothetical protein